MNNLAIHRFQLFFGKKGIACSKIHGAVAQDSNSTPAANSPVINGYSVVKAHVITKDNIVVGIRKSSTGTGDRTPRSTIKRIRSTIIARNHEKQKRGKQKKSSH